MSVGVQYQDWRPATFANPSPALEYAHVLQLRLDRLGDESDALPYGLRQGFGVLRENRQDRNDNNGGNNNHPNY